ncbi:glycosyltransferase, exosortase A system-associated [Altererythrobacter indicus]|uniref:Glycosyltransferase, exosortase A system-associated n=1 Tax=Altericroceibacterium indicum TaxID=374177 RepID=A0A845A7G5_9SPHN|nr:TIGR04063 family PEP-CTERM/XrtA system glycosyltransferase [Altericroceibacterium indicum]MXP26312.1 glycosyltransferase, exosortase A system-associated [Altericroceibacterium indicum]
MTRILHVLDHSLPLQSGYTFRTRAILKAQQALGYEVCGVTGQRHVQDGPLVEEVDGLRFHRTPGKPSGPSGFAEWREIGAFAQRIEQLVGDWKPDIIHAHSPALCGAAAARVARRHGIPMVYEIRAFWEDAAVGNGSVRANSLKYRLTRALENHVIRSADAIVTICAGLRDDLLERHCPAERITIMPNGVDLTLFGTAPPRDSALAQELGLNDGPVIGFIGSFYDYEGLDDLINAMPYLTARYPDARLLMVGGGPMAGSLKFQAENSPAADAICFTGRVPHDQVERYYSLCDIMAYPRKKSRLTDLVTPLKPLEAMAQGKLVAASDVGGHRELINDGETGVLFAPDNPEACGAALVSLIDRKDKWPTFIEQARKHVERNHDWARNVNRYQDVYDALLSKASN